MLFKSTLFKFTFNYPDASYFSFELYSRLFRIMGKLQLPNEFILKFAQSVITEFLT